jgi:hypothetical protein
LENSGAVRTCALFDLDITTDRYAEDVSWNLIGGGGVALASGNNYDGLNNQNLDIPVVCIPLDECYTFTIKDDYGDGLWYVLRPSRFIT